MSLKKFSLPGNGKQIISDSRHLRRMASPPHEIQSAMHETDTMSLQIRQMIQERIRATNPKEKSLAKPISDVPNNTFYSNQQNSI